MAETLLSPGVLARENDNTFIQQQPVEAGAAIVGPAVKGPVEIPTLVTSYSDYQNRFGTTFESGSDEYTYLTSISAYNYFQNGGDSLLVTRVVDDSSNWTYASASVVNSRTVTGGEFSVGDFTLVAAFTQNEEIRLTYDGVVYRFIAEEAPIPADDIDGRVYYYSTGSTATETAENFSSSFASNISFIDATNTLNVLEFSASAEGATYNGVTISTGSSNDFATQVTLAGGLNGTGTSTAFELEVLDKGELFNNTSSILSNNSLDSGSKDNIRWEVASSDSTNGQFSLIVRRGDDNHNSKIALETYQNLSLDPKSENYISKVIGDQKLVYNSTENYIEVSGSYPNASRYVRVKSVNSKTPDYFDNAGVAKTQYADFLPTVGSGSYGGSFAAGVGSLIPSSRKANYYHEINGTDTQGLVSGDYTDMLSLLANADDYRYNLMLLPGLTDASHQLSIINSY